MMKTLLTALVLSVTLASAALANPFVAAPVNPPKKKAGKVAARSPKKGIGTRMLNNKNPELMRLKGQKSSVKMKALDAQ